MGAEIDANFPSLDAFFEPFQESDPSFSKIIGKWSLPQGSEPTFQDIRFLNVLDCLIETSAQPV